MSTTAALTVACPTCSSAAGDPCRSRPKNRAANDKLPTTAPHAARKTAAAEHVAKLERLEAESAALAAAAKKRTCTYCSIRLTAKNSEKFNDGYCNACFEQAGIENDHQDGNHEAGSEMTTCPMCNPAIDRANRKPVVQTSHADCDHPSTKAGRAACRRERAKAAA